MNNFAIFVAAYWLQAEENGDTVHWGDAQDCFKHAQKEPNEYAFLQPYYDKIKEKTAKLSQPQPKA